MTSSNACHYHISDGSDTLKQGFGSAFKKWVQGKLKKDFP